jgi:tetratricopeptide (TPR) repeat protein
MISSMVLRFVSAFLSLVAASIVSFAQSSPSQPTAASGANHAITLATTGRCTEAIPELKRAVHQSIAAELKKKAELAGLRCAMTHNQPYEAGEFLQVLNRDFHDDPEVLYQATHAYSDLAIRASQDLLRVAPNSYQVHELNAESLETQGKWDDAAAEYRKILENNTNLPGIHYRLGRLLLSKPNPGPDIVEEAKKNFEQELKIDPQNAGAEYVLGELARQSSQFSEAVDHFSRATKLDTSFAEAYLGLGSSLIGEKRYADALQPLETGVKLQPENPAGHYDLATALSRTGHKEEAEREFAIHRKMQEANPPAAPQ